MNIAAFCNATGYNIKALMLNLQTRFKATLYRDVVHAEIPFEEKIIDAFFFPYGAFVLWGVDSDQGRFILPEVESFQDETHEKMEFDDFTFCYGEKPTFVEDNIVLPNTDILTKLAASHGIAQSVKLGAFEYTISKTFDKTKHIPENLAKWGKISLSRKEIRKKMGQLFLDRTSVNLHVDVLDTPEFFWEYPELEPLYLMIANELDIETRGEVLNHRLDVVKELFGMLAEELNTQHSSRLELTIVILIVIEVVISLSVNVFSH